MKDSNDTAAEAIRNGGGPDEVAAALDERTSNTRPVNVPLPSDDGDDSSQHIAALLNDPELLNPPPRIPTSFEALDAALAGGLVLRGMYVLAGLTGRGKSTLCANLARRLAVSGNQVLWVTLEDEPLIAARRLLAQVSGVPIIALENFQRPGAVTREEVRRVEDAKHVLAALPLRIDTTVSDIHDLERQVRRHAAQGTKVCLIDQSSWLHVPDADGPFAEAAQIARRLKILAKELGVVIVILVQVNRTGANAIKDGQDIELFHIRDSGKWEEDSDAVLIMQSMDDAPDGSALMRVDLKKHRRGQSGSRVHLKARLTCGIIEDSPLHLAPEDIAAAKQKEKDVPAADAWSAARLANECCREIPQIRTVILAAARAAGLSSERRFKELLDVAVSEGRIYELPRKGNEPQKYSTKRPEEREHTPPHTPPPSGRSASLVGAGVSSCSLSKPRKKQKSAKSTLPTQPELPHPHNGSMPR